MAQSRKRILIVEDEADLRELLMWTLAQAGFEVAVAADGEAALRNAAAAIPDLVLLDLLLPKVDGYGVCRHLRERPETASVPVLILSATDAPDSPNRCRACGATDFIAKPFSVRDLKDRIVNALSSPHCTH